MAYMLIYKYTYVPLAFSELGFASSLQPEEIFSECFSFGSSLQPHKLLQTRGGHTPSGVMTCAILHINSLAIHLRLNPPRVILTPA